MSSDALWIIVIGSMVGIVCSMGGVFLVLRRLSMIGDAISHSVLLGLVIAFLLSGSRAPWIMFIGAALSGVATAYLSGVLNREGKLQEDASLGIIFTSFFALAVVLISLYADKIDLDQDCVLNGEIAFAPLELLVIGGTSFGPRAFWSLASVLILIGLFLLVGWRKINLLTFDPTFAASVGVRVDCWHYALMALVSLATVASFESVGAILVVAMLVLPANIALIFSRSVGQTLVIASLVSVGSAIGGYQLAAAIDGSISAAIVVVMSALFATALLARWLHDRWLQSVGRTSAPDGF